MEDQEKSIEGKRKMSDYVRWFCSAVFALLMLATIIAAIYRKYIE